ncbi:MAG: DUF3662 domain-containing protein [Chloroflexi bacterium]|nr:DUF3662 domain-containing protein [Chloroflexota bacterium]
MNALTRFEGFVENLLEGSLTGMLRGKLQPVEIAKRLSRSMESSKSISIGRIFVANDYHVYLSPKDYQRLEPIRATMERELAEYLAGVAREQRFSLVSKPTITLKAEEALPTRQMRVEARFSETPAVTAPAAGDQPPLEIGQTRRFDAEQLKRSLRGVAANKAALVCGSGATNGMRYYVDKPNVTMGRGLGNEIVVDDPRVSRHHAEIRLTGGKICIYDLKSTNGTWVNRQRITESVLANGDVISLGGVEFTFETTPGL